MTTIFLSNFYKFKKILNHKIEKKPTLLHNKDNTMYVGKIIKINVAGEGVGWIEVGKSIRGINYDGKK